jgi:hypothetical protein
LESSLRKSCFAPSAKYCGSRPTNIKIAQRQPGHVPQLTPPIALFQQSFTSSRITVLWTCLGFASPGITTVKTCRRADCAASWQATIISLCPYRLFLARSQKILELNPMNMSSCFACSHQVSHSGSPGFRQLLLGASKNGELCIQPPSTSMPGTLHGLTTDKQNDPPLKQSFVTRIPDELLNDIFTLSLGNEHYFQSEYYHTALSLSIVSKHFHHIVQPLMYRTINIGGHSLVKPCLAVKQLHRTVKENRALGSMVKTLYVHIDAYSATSEAEYKVATEILDLLPNVESFDLHGGFEGPSTWPMIRNAIRNWARIKHVGLSREDFTLRMPPVCELIVATPNLMTLDLYGVYAFHGSSGTSTTSYAVWTPPSKVVIFYLLYYLTIMC